MSKDYTIDVLPQEEFSTTEKFRGEQIYEAPQSALTAASGTPSSGGAQSNTDADAAVINNIITRVGQIETALENLGLIRTN